MTTWTQERPTWCQHIDCRQLGAGVNSHRLCIRTDDTSAFDLQITASDCDWLRWILDAIDGKRTSWLSQEPER